MLYKAGNKKDKYCQTVKPWLHEENRVAIFQIKSTRDENKDKVLK